MIVKKNTLAFWSGLEYRDPPFLNRVYLVPESSNKVYSRDTPDSEYSIATEADGTKFRVMASDVFTLKTEPIVHPSKLTCTWKIQMANGDPRVVLVVWGGSPGSEHIPNPHMSSRSSFELTTLGRTYASTWMAVHPAFVSFIQEFNNGNYFSEHSISCRVVYKSVTYDTEPRNIKISRPKWDYWWNYWV